MEIHIQLILGQILAVQNKTTETKPLVNLKDFLKLL